MRKLLFSTLVGIAGLGLWTATPAPADASWLSEALHAYYDPYYGYYGPSTYPVPYSYDYGTYYEPYLVPGYSYSYWYTPGPYYRWYGSYYAPRYRRGYYGSYRSGWGRGRYSYGRYRGRGWGRGRRHR